MGRLRGGAAPHFRGVAAMWRESPIRIDPEKIRALNVNPALDLHISRSISRPNQVRWDAGIPCT
jgi:hypothetical protein